jgi:hypothetical protein
MGLDVRIFYWKVRRRHDFGEYGFYEFSIERASVHIKLGVF